MEKTLKGTLLGFAAGIIGVIPMFFMGLPFESEVSAFLLWLVAGFLVASSGLSIPGWQKGLVVSFAVLAPCAVLIGWSNPSDLIPVLAMTMVLGSVLGNFSDS